MRWMRWNAAHVKRSAIEASNELTTRPQFLIIGGVNGAGKSTLVGNMDFSRGQSQLLLNPDDVTKVILRETPIAEAQANFAALRRISEQVTSFIAHGHTFVSETVLANHAYIRHAIAAKAAGYEVRLIYVGLPTVEHAIERVADRVSKGGHDVPEDLIRRRWEPSHRNLGWFAKNVEGVEVFSNTDIKPKLIARARDSVIEIVDAAELPAVTTVLAPPRA